MGVSVLAADWALEVYMCPLEGNLLNGKLF